MHERNRWFRLRMPSSLQLCLLTNRFFCCELARRGEGAGDVVTRFQRRRVGSVDSSSTGHSMPAYGGGGADARHAIERRRETSLYRNWSGLGSAGRRNGEEPAGFATSLDRRNEGKLGVV